MSEEIKKTEEVVEGNETDGEGAPVVVTTKKQTWLNRIWSAAVGAVVAVGAMFGITQPQIDAQKAKVTEVKTKAASAVEALKAGDTQTAIKQLQEVVGDAKAIAEQAKKDLDTMKTKATDVKNTVTEPTKTAPTTTAPTNTPAATTPVKEQAK